MCGVTVREYRSDTCTGSNPVSATRKLVRSTLGPPGCAAAGSGGASDAQLLCGSQGRRLDPRCRGRLRGAVQTGHGAGIVTVTCTSGTLAGSGFTLAQNEVASLIKVGTNFECV